VRNKRQIKKKEGKAEKLKRANQLKCVAPIEPQHTQQLQFVLILLVYYYRRRRGHDWCHQTVFKRCSIESELISFTDLWAPNIAGWGKGRTSGVWTPCNPDFRAHSSTRFWVVISGSRSMNCICPAIAIAHCHNQKFQMAMRTCRLFFMEHHWNLWRESSTDSWGLSCLN